MLALNGVDPNKGCPLGCMELPACTRLYNVFHPYDPVAYRMEPLVLRTGQVPPPAAVPLSALTLR